MTDEKKVRVLFVCMGNICRSPTAEGVFRKMVNDGGLAERIEIESAGTGAWHEGESPDARSQAEARRHGIDLSGQRARAVRDADFENFDYILAMDHDNLKGLRSRCPNAHTKKLYRLTEFAKDLNEEVVPDPYYGGPRGFERVFEIISAGCAGLLEQIASKHLKAG